MGKCGKIIELQKEKNHVIVILQICSMLHFYKTRQNNMVIKRDLYLKKLIERKNNSLIKVITGIRRSGKSFLLFNLFKTHLLSEGVKENHIIELNFDDFENEEYKDPKIAYPYLKSKIIDTDTYYFLLDEIQLLDRFESVLNGLLRIPNVDIYVTGSNAKFLSKDVITEFRGRGDEIHIYPLSFLEFFSAQKKGKDKTEALDEYITYGGIPLILSRSSHEAKAQFLKNLFIETYLKDIIDRNNLNQTEELKELVSIVSSSIGSLTNPTKLSNTFKSVKNVNLTSPTISKYLELLNDSFLISKALRYNLKGKKYIDSPSKYYFSDLGIRNAALNFRQIEKTHLMENLIYNELLVRGYSVDVGEVTQYIRDENKTQSRKTLEIDFVCNQIDKKIYIQSAYSIENHEKYIQESRSLLNIHDSFKKIIITYDNSIMHYTEDGILIMNIYDFLLDANSLE